MVNPLVSIIIPLYNSEKYVEETITSAIGQTWENKEIIIIDDGSTDNSLNIARLYACNRVKVFTQTNSGASSARNNGLSEARGDYIQFMDADDLLAPDKIEKQLLHLLQHKDHIALGATVHFNDGTQPDVIIDSSDEMDITDPVYFLQRMYGGSLIQAGFEGMIQPNAWLTPRPLIDKAGKWDERLTLDDDGEYFCRVVLQSQGVIYVSGAINYYRKFKKSRNLSSSSDYNSYKSALLSINSKSDSLMTKADNNITRIALARLYKEYVVTVYPTYRDLYLQAMEKLNILGDVSYIPRLGGPKIEFIKKILGWKFARRIQTMRLFN